MRLGPADVTLERKADGTIFLRSPHALERYPDKLTQRLEHWAKAAPDRVFIAQRTAAGDWRKLTYAQTLAQVRGIAQALLERKLSPERPIAILSGNDIEHALLGARRDDGRHSLRADLGALLADVERLRQAEVDRRRSDARAWFSPPTASRSRARSTPRCRSTPKSS